MLPAGLWEGIRGKSGGIVVVGMVVVFFDGVQVDEDVVGVSRRSLRGWKREGRGTREAEEVGIVRVTQNERRDCHSLAGSVGLSQVSSLAVSREGGGELAML